MTELQKVFCDNLKRLREEHNLSQGDLDKLTGIDQARLSKIENGKVEPGLLTIERIVQGLGVLATELFIDTSVRDTSLLKKVSRIEFLPKKDQDIINGVLDGFLEKEHFTALFDSKAKKRLTELGTARGSN